LPGGAAAIKRPRRTAIGYILTLLGENALNAVIASEAKQSQLASIGQVTEVEVEVIKRQIERRINSPLSSSMGRLFDAISALLGIRGEIDYEGQAAVELEMAALSSVIARPVPSEARELDEAISHAQESYPYRIVEDEGIRIVRLGGLLSAGPALSRNGRLTSGYLKGEDIGQIPQYRSPDDKRDVSLDSR